MIHLRIGCPTDNFDLNETMIDFELASQQNQPLSTFRIKSDLLSEEEISEIQFVLCKITPLTDVSLGLVKFKHDGNGFVYFYGLEITDVASGVMFYFPVRLINN